MDLNQIKLAKNEWETIEIPVSSGEKKILKLICEGFDNINAKFNEMVCLLVILKITNNEEMEQYLFDIYFKTQIETIAKKK